MPADFSFRRMTERSGGITPAGWREEVVRISPGRRGQVSFGSDWGGRGYRLRWRKRFRVSPEVLASLTGAIASLAAFSRRSPCFMKPRRFLWKTKRRIQAS